MPTKMLPRVKQADRLIYRTTIKSVRSWGNRMDVFPFEAQQLLWRTFSTIIDYPSYLFLRSVVAIGLPTYVNMTSTVEVTSEKYA